MIGPETRVADLVYERLREQILAGKLEPGARLRQVELAEEFEISQTPVREALARLASDGLVALRPRRGAEVVALSPREVEEVYELRALIEPYAVERAAEVASDEQLATIRELAEVPEGLSPRELFDRNRRFHRSLCEGAGNGRLLQVIDGLWSSVTAVRMFDAYAVRGGAEVAATMADEHRAIADAVAKRDGATAAELARRHITAARRELLGRIDQEEGC